MCEEGLDPRLSGLGHLEGARTSGVCEHGVRCSVIKIYISNQFIRISVTQHNMQSMLLVAGSMTNKGHTLSGCVTI